MNSAGSPRFMSNSLPAEPIRVDRAVSFPGHRFVIEGDVLGAAREAFNEAGQRCTAEARRPVLVEVRIYVAPKES